jgi:hypothetical protein
MRESKRKQFKGAVLQLGRQEIYATDEAMLRMAREERCPVFPVEGDFRPYKSKYFATDSMNDAKFFRMLGFETVHSIDVSDWEGADFIHDFNRPLPDDAPYLGKYAAVVDGGTLEHIFHVPNALKNIFELLAVGGRVLHQVPVDLFNHGFYNFGTCLFEDFYRTNNFDIDVCAVVATPYSPDPNGPARFVSASAGSQFVRSLSSDTFDGAEHLLFVVATKRADSTGDKIPTQGYYQDAFAKKENFGNNGLVEGDSLLKAAYGKVNTLPVVGNVARRLRNVYARSLVKWDKL